MAFAGRVSPKSNISCTAAETSAPSAAMTAARPFAAQALGPQPAAEAARHDEERQGRRGHSDRAGERQQLEAVVVRVGPEAAQRLGLDQREGIGESTQPGAGRREVPP